MTWFEQLHQAAFAGHRFRVQATQVGGGFVGSTEVQIGRGSRMVPHAPDMTTYDFDAYFAGPRTLADVLAFEARLGQGPGLLVHPFFGATDALCRRWTVAFRAAEIEYAQVTLEFARTELPPVASAPASVTTPIVLDEIVIEAAGFAAEPVALGELAAAAPSLGIPLEPPDAVPEATTRALLADAATPMPGTPGAANAIRALGVGLRHADAGQLDPAGRDAVAMLLLREAARTDSLTLMSMRESFLTLSLALGSAGSMTIDGNGRLLSAVALDAGVEPGALAARNRDAVSGWFVRGEVRL